MPLCIYKTRFEKTGYKNAETPDFSGVSGECIYFGHSWWQREKDSNPHIRSQSPLCYHYTIPLCSLDEHLLLYQRFFICQELIANFPDFFHFGAAGCFRSAFQRQSRSDGAGGKRLARGAAGDRSAAWLFRRKENLLFLRIWWKCRFPFAL